MERTEFKNLIDRLEFVHPDSNSLGLAALSRDMGDSAVKEGRYDEAWRHYHDQKTYFLKHANMCKLTPVYFRGHFFKGILKQLSA